MPMAITKGMYILTANFKSLLSQPATPIAATAIAMLCGEIIFPAQAPAALAAVTQADGAEMASEASVCSLPNNTQLEVAEPVMKVPIDPIKAAMNGYMVPVAPTAVSAI